MDHAQSGHPAGRSDGRPLRETPSKIVERDDVAAIGFLHYHLAKIAISRGDDAHTTEWVYS